MRAFLFPSPGSSPLLLPAAGTVSVPVSAPDSSAVSAPDSVPEATAVPVSASSALAPAPSPGLAAESKQCEAGFGETGRQLHLLWVHLKSAATALQSPLLSHPLHFFLLTRCSLIYNKLRPRGTKNTAVEEEEVK